MKFSQRLVTELKPIWEANHHHPFVQELAMAPLISKNLSSTWFKITFT